MASQIKSYVSDFDLLQKEQSGFREHHSCMTALTKMTETWLWEMDSGNLTGTVLLDFSKAFDLVNHNILLHKLKVYKFSEQTLTLKLYCRYLYTRPCMINHIWGLKQL